MDVDIMMKRTLMDAAIMKFAFRALGSVLFKYL